MTKVQSWFRGMQPGWGARRPGKKANVGMDGAVTLLVEPEPSFAGRSCSALAVLACSGYVSTHHKCMGLFPLICLYIQHAW